MLQWGGEIENDRNGPTVRACRAAGVESDAQHHPRESSTSLTFLMIGVGLIRCPVLSRAAVGFCRGFRFGANERISCWPAAARPESEVAAPTT